MLIDSTQTNTSEKKQQMNTLIQTNWGHIRTGSKLHSFTTKNASTHDQGT